MTEQEILTALAKKKAGQITRIVYTSDLPLKASVKKEGCIDVFKIVAITARTGCQYDHIKTVKDKLVERAQLIASGQLEAKAPRESWYNWKQPNVLKQNKATNELYLNVQTLPKHSNPAVTYVINGKPITKEKLIERDLVIPSYWTKSSDSIDTFDIKIANVLLIK